MARGNPSTDHDRSDPVRWSIEQRLAFAANRLFWDGALQREDIIRRFGVSPTQATSDIARLRAALGPAIAYDVSRRAYVPGSGEGGSAAMVPPADAEVLLQELRLITEGCLPSDLSILSSPPPVTIAGTIARAVETGVLRAVLVAIRDKGALAADYVSFQRPDVSRRILSPHALVFDGFRWHARAHDAEDGRFKDFVLSRLSEPAAAGPARIGAIADAAWNNMVTLSIIPHPGLSPHQKAVVMRDYGMTGGKLALTVRDAVSFYARKRLGLIDGHADRPPHEQQIVLASS
jgi:predicted DNA-binding transcriptional regulator YafY